MSIVLDAFSIDATDPDVQAEQQDFHDFADLITALVARRKSLGLTQTDVARRMDTKQSAVSAIESSSANPTVQRLQRYARAVNARLTLHAHEQTSNDGEWRTIDSPITEEVSVEKSAAPHLMIVGGPKWNVLGVTLAA